MLCVLRMKRVFPFHMFILHRFGAVVTEAAYLCNRERLLMLHGVDRYIERILFFICHSPRATFDLRRIVLIQQITQQNERKTVFFHSYFYAFGC